jgi:hypothetical protein
MNNHIIDDHKQIRYCRYCNKRLRPIDYSFFIFGFDLDGMVAEIAVLNT